MAEELKEISEGVTKGILDWVSSIGGLQKWIKEKFYFYIPSQFNVILALDFNEGMNSGIYYSEIKRQVIKIVDQVGLSSEIRIKDVSDIKGFANKKEAEEYRQRKDVDLIIWGGFTTDGLRVDGKDTNKLDINFTYKYPENKENQIGPIILMDLSSKLAIKNYWQIYQDSSLKDVEIISSNIADLSIYIIALVLKISGNFESSLSHFERLLELTTQRNDNVFRQQLVPHLLNCYELIVVYSITTENNWSNALKLCNKMLTLDPNNFFALATSTRAYYEIKDYVRSAEVTNNLLNLYPRNPLVEVDVAFQEILKKNYKLAHKHYLRLTEKSNEMLNFNPIEVIAFLQNEYEIRKDPMLLFSSGFISYHYGDKEIAKQDLSIYLTLSSEHTSKEMYREAKRLMKSL